MNGTITVFFGSLGKPILVSGLDRHTWLSRSTSQTWA